MPRSVRPPMWVPAMQMPQGMQLVCQCSIVQLRKETAHLDCCHVGCGGVACKVQALEAAPQFGQRVKRRRPRLQRILAEPEVLASEARMRSNTGHQHWTLACKVFQVSAGFSTLHGKHLPYLQLRQRRQRRQGRDAVV